MDPVALMVAAAAVGVAAAAVTVVVITMKNIMDWFRARARIVISYRRAVYFTVAEQINGKKYTEIPGVFGGQTATTRIVQGVYDLDDSKIIDVRVIESSAKVEDKEVISLHDKGGGMVIYQ
jgi:hypothetical protein